MIRNMKAKIVMTASELGNTHKLPVENVLKIIVYDEDQRPIAITTEERRGKTWIVIQGEAQLRVLPEAANQLIIKHEPR